MMKNEKEFYQMLGELKRQDVELHRLFAERQEIRKKCEKLGGMPLVNTKCFSLMVNHTIVSKIGA